VYEKSGAPAVWTLAGILSWSTAPGMGFAVVASAGAGAGAAGARVAGPVALTTGALRGGGATGVVAMTWISGSFVALELEASCATTVLGAIARAIENAQSDPWSGTRMTEALIRSAKPERLPTSPPPVLYPNRRRNSGTDMPARVSRIFFQRNREVLAINPGSFGNRAIIDIPTARTEPLGCWQLNLLSDQCQAKCSAKKRAMRPAKRASGSNASCLPELLG
jgi:hypothetical protein